MSEGLLERRVIESDEARQVSAYSGRREGDILIRLSDVGIQERIQAAKLHSKSNGAGMAG